MQSVDNSNTGDIQNQALQDRLNQARQRVADFKKQQANQALANLSQKESAIAGGESGLKKEIKQTLQSSQHQAQSMEDAGTTVVQGNSTTPVAGGFSLGIKIQTQDTGQKVILPGLIVKTTVPAGGEKVEKVAQGDTYGNAAFEYTADELKKMPAGNGGERNVSVEVSFADQPQEPVHTVDFPVAMSSGGVANRTILVPLTESLSEVRDRGLIVLNTFNCDKMAVQGVHTNMSDAQTHVIGAIQAYKAGIADLKAALSATPDNPPDPAPADKVVSMEVFNRG